MRFTGLSLAVGASCLFQSGSATYCKIPAGKATDVDVAIIGGGSGGIHAAIQLKDAGAKVAVIEKKDQIGGHAETYYDPTTGKPTNMGVVLFENSTVVTKYFARLNVSTAATSLTALGSASTKSYDFALGYPIPAQNSSAQAAQVQAATTAGMNYVANVLSKYPWVDQGFFVPSPVPEELTMPFGEFAKKYEFTALLSTISQLNWYPGNLSTIPALYGIKSFGPGLLQSVSGNFLVSGTGDTRSLYKSAATELDGAILLNSTIVSIEREGKSNTTYPVTVVVKQPGQAAKTIRARKLIIAIPPTLDNVGGYDLSSNERDLFSKFSAVGYLAGIAKIPGLTSSIMNVGAMTPYNTPVIPGSNGFNVANTAEGFNLGVAFDNTDYTEDDAVAVIRRELGTLAKLGAVPSDSAEKVTFPYLTNHAPYNVRVSGEEIANGFYGKFLGLEGTRNTYWTGAAFSGHNSGLVWTWNEGTVIPALTKELGL